MSNDAPTAWLVIAHGSRAADLADAHNEVCAELAEQAPPGVMVRPAYLELTEPSIPDAVDAAVADSATRVVLLPYFLHIGNHTRRDLPAILEQAQERHPGVDLVLAEHLGIDSRLVAILADRAAAAQARLDHRSP